MNLRYFKNLSALTNSLYESFITSNFNISIDGSRTTELNIADYFSAKLCYRALETNIKKSDIKPQRLPGLKFTPEEFFWISSAQKYCFINKHETTVRKLITTSYPIELYRVYEPLSNNFDFKKDFQCF